MTRLALAATMVVVVGANFAQAADKPDPTGTWKWSVTFNDQTREFTLKLKLEGDKLTGAMVGQDGTETKIDEASFKDGTVAFGVTRERNGQKRTTKYNGKLDGDAIKGKAEFERNGEKMSRDWEAKRSK